MRNAALKRLQASYQRKTGPNNGGSNYDLITLWDIQEIFNYIEDIEIENGKLREQLQALMQVNARLLTDAGASVGIDEIETGRDSLSETAEP